MVVRVSHDRTRSGTRVPPLVEHPVDDPAPLTNADCPWELFDSTWYLAHNYQTLRDDDRRIIELLAEFFEAHSTVRKWHGIDVGSGTNLYPALAMLPLIDTVTLWEYSAPNVRWLEYGIRPYAPSWEQFWQVLASSARIYQRERKPQSALFSAAKVERGSVFELPEARWDVGTMFFVAESITGDRREFEAATTKFVRALKPGAPFAAAFMRNSHGYTVGTQRFPAVAVTEYDVRRVLNGIATEVRIHSISSGEPLREGYDGMILATGVRVDTRR